MFARASIAAIVGTCASMASAQTPPVRTFDTQSTGRITFQSYTPASQTPFLTRAYLGMPPVTVHGDLTLPKQSPLARAGKVPAVILVHGTGGVSVEREHAWAQRFNSWGIAAFVVDSYTGRGIKPPAYADQSNFIHVVAHILDAYLALQLLATHPRLDGTRVAIMGGSRGGETALGAMLEPFRRAALGDAPHRFAAFVPFYPFCSYRNTSASFTNAPVLMLLGGADDMTGVVPCQNQATSLRARGVDIRVIVYPGAHHGFDRQSPVRLDPNHIGVIKCEAEYDLDTRVARRLDTGARLASKADHDAWLDACRHKGARFGGDPKALAAAIGEVRRFLTGVFGTASGKAP